MSHVGPPHPPLRPPPGPEHPPNPLWKWLAISFGSVLVLGAVLAAFGVGQDKSNSAAPATSPAATAGDRSPATTTATTPTAPTTEPPATTSTTAEPAAAPATTTTQPPRSPSAPSAPAPAKRSAAYDNAEGVCEGLGLAAIAKQMHVPADPVSVAQAVAKQYRATFQADAVAGCRAGLRKHG